MGKLKDIAERLNRGWVFHDFRDPENDVTKLITGLYKSAAKNFDYQEEELNRQIEMWRKHP